MYCRAVAAASAEELDALEAERKAIALVLQGAEQKVAEDEAAEGQPRPILPYSSLFVLGPSNMYAPRQYWPLHQECSYGDRILNSIYC